MRHHRRVGYIFFRNFVEPSVEALDAAFATLGQGVFTFCDKALAPVAFVLRNANGEGNFFEGFAPTCAAADDLNFQIGDPNEASLKEALVFAGTGACSPRPAGAQQTAPRARPERVEGWQSVVNAY